MKPTADEAPTEVELEVAQILRELPELFAKAESRRFPGFIRWGGRRRRSALNDDIALLDPPPPPPSISPPPHGNVERKDGDRGGSDGVTSSPATPLSFPASGGEEPDGRPPRPPFSPPAKVFKTTKRHREWVEKQNQLIASLSDQKAQLLRSIAEFDALYQQLKAKNSWLQDLQSKSMEEEGQKQRQQQQPEDGVSGLAPLGPISLQSGATRSLVDPDNQRWEIQPPPVDENGGTPTPSVVVVVGRWPEKMVALDLNASPVEEERSSAYEAAMSAQAKKRRLEITHDEEKNYSSSPSSSFSLFSMAQKMPRLR